MGREITAQRLGTPHVKATHLASKGDCHERLRSYSGNARQSCRGQGQRPPPTPEQEVTNMASSAWPVQWTPERSRGQGHQAGSGAKWVAARGSRTWRRRLAARDPQKQAWRQGPGTG